VILKLKFPFHEKGVICLCPGTKSRENRFINGIEFEFVDNELIRQRRDEGADMTKVCTSLGTDMKPDHISNINSSLPQSSPFTLISGYFSRVSKGLKSMARLTGKIDCTVCLLKS
jgi:hypothetical protein